MIADREMRYYLERLQDENLAGRDRARAYEAFTTAAENWVPAALDRIDLVRELHQPLPASPLCQECLQLWPCPTLRIIDGERDDQ